MSTTHKNTPTNRSSQPHKKTSFSILFSKNQRSAARKGESPSRKPSSKDRRDSQARAPAAPPPVMARGYNMDIPFQANRAYRKNNRRRIDVPLKVQGAEMRLPSLPMIRFSYRWWALILGVVFLGGLYYLWNAPFFRVEAAQIEGANRVKASDINAVLDASKKPVFALHPTELQNKLLEAFPELSSVVIEVSLPNTMKVMVVERVPVLTWRQDDIDKLVDEGGFAFPLRLEASSPITPLVEAAGNPPSLGVSSEAIAALIENELKQVGADQKNQDNGPAGQAAPLQPFINPEMVSAILAMSKVAPANMTLIYDGNHGLGWLDERGWQIYLGDAQDMEMKLRVVDAIVQRLISEEVQPALISVEHVHNPYYRVEQ
jgi:cell division septal protein FtsQ